MSERESHRLDIEKFKECMCISKFRKRILSVLLIAAMLFSAVFPGGIFVKAESANKLSDGSFIYQVEDYYTGDIYEAFGV